jgi:hypothetical protein
VAGKAPLQQAEGETGGYAGQAAEYADRGGPSSWGKQVAFRKAAKKQVLRFAQDDTFLVRNLVRKWMTVFM